jgi:succinylglutamate desuccinylase
MYEKVIILKGKKNGPTSMIIGGIHGNETCGVTAINKILPTIKIDAGKLIIAYGNPRAIQKKVRFIDSNLNRLFRSPSLLSKKEKKSYEYKRALFLKKYLNQAKYLLDIHASFTPKSRGFIICEKNAARIRKYLPQSVVVNGFDNVQPGGTDFYMNKIGNVGICIECGYKDDPKSTQVALKSINSFLIATGNIKEKIFINKQKIIRIYKQYKTKTNNFLLAKNFNDFDIVKNGQLIATDGYEEIKASKKSIILFALNTKNIGDEAFLLGK